MPDRRDLTQLCIVSKELHDRTLPKLYETVIVSSESEKHLERIDINPFLRGNGSSRLRYTKHVRIAAPFHENLDERCVHFRDIDDHVKYLFDEEPEEREAKGLTRFQKLATNAAAFLQQIEDESLKSFRSAAVSTTIFWESH